MKKMMNIFTSLLLAVFLISAVITIVGCKQNPDEKTESEKDSESKNESETEKDYLVIPIKDLYLWGEDKGSYDSKSGKLILKNDEKDSVTGANIVFNQPEDFENKVQEYKYLMLAYENLNYPNVWIHLEYEDESYSEVYLQTKGNAAYIELDKDKKSKIKMLAFMSRCEAAKYGIEESTLTVKEIRLVKEKPAINKEPVSDKKEGSFDEKNYSSGAF